MIAVTGAAGFVGRALCRALDTGAVPYQAVGRMARIGMVGVGDIGPATDWAEALQGVDTVVHLAARVHRMREEGGDLLARYRDTNVAGTLRLARQARAAGVRRLVFVSSIKVNGERTTGDQQFSPDDAPAPADPYGISKLEAERGLFALGQEIGLEIVVVRPPLVYGRGVGANFRALVSLVERGIPLPLGAIRNKRSLIAVDNLASLLIRCSLHPEAAGRTFLCSDGRDISTPELLRAIGEACGRRVVLLPVPTWALTGAATLFGRADAGRRLTESLRVDASTTSDVLGWTPPLSFETALALSAAQGWSDAHQEVLRPHHPARS